MDGSLKGLPLPTETNLADAAGDEIDRRLREHVEDLELLEAIQKDVTRTYPDIKYFNGPDAVNPF